jgi:DNA repair protein RecN (Recombination protein N)
MQVLYTRLDSSMGDESLCSRPFVETLNQVLEELRIKNLAVVEDVALDLGPGLNVLTGSTGAGKSLILGAVNLLLGGRGSTRAIRTGKDRASVEGVFLPVVPLADKLLSAALPVEARQISIRRQIDHTGRSQAFINDRPCPLKQLQEVSVQLIEPHGQNEQLQLKHSENHVIYVDRFAGNEALRAAYGTVLEHFQEAARELADFEKRLALAREKKELLEHRVDEVTRAAIRPGEREELEESIRVLSHGREIFDVLNEAGEQIYDDDSSAVARVGHVRKRLSRIEGLDKKLAEFAEQLGKAEVQLGETMADMRAFAENLDFEPGNLERMQERLDFLLGLERRYQMSVDELTVQAGAWSSELESLIFADEERAKLTGEKTKCLGRLRDSGRRLSRSRQQAAKRLDKQMTHEIEQLMLRGARFRTHFGYELDDASDLVVDGQRVRPRLDGIDEVTFCVQTNPGEVEGRVCDVASSGELSRIALALKSVVSMGKVGSVLIFDELDAGVGGDMGDVIADKLAKLAENYQIVCITHMPQIAARATRHLVVKKATHKGRTSAKVEPAAGDERVEEIARMLGGKEGSQKRLALAREMLDKSKTTSNARP